MPANHTWVNLQPQGQCKRNKDVGTRLASWLHTKPRVARKARFSASCSSAAPGLLCFTQHVVCPISSSKRIAEVESERKAHSRFCYCGRARTRACTNTSQNCIKAVKRLNLRISVLENVSPRCQPVKSRRGCRGTTKHACRNAFFVFCHREKI